MISRFKSIFSGNKKTDLNNNSFNFPINEKSFEINHNESSFLTYHSALNQSFHGSDVQTMNSETESNENEHSSLNQNFTSILNVPQPKTNSFIIELYNILSETIKNKISQTSIPTVNLETLNVTSADFQNYINNIKTQYEFYLKSIKLKQFEEDNKLNEVNINEALVNCYDCVPASFFDESFIFNFQNFSRNIKKMNEIQENLSEYLDEIELNLYYQITTRFHSFLDVILNLNKMDQEINSTITNIQNLRKYQKYLSNNVNKPSERILKLKKKYLNIQKTINLLELIKTIRMTVPTLETLIQNENYDYSVTLLKSSENTYNSKLKPLACLQNFYPSLKQSKAGMEETLSKDFVEKLTNYMQSCTIYAKNYQSLDVSMMDDSFIGSAILNETLFADTSLIQNDDPINTKLLWSFVENKPNNELEQKICRILINLINIKEFSLRNYKFKLLDVLKSLNKKFLKDIVEYYDFIKKNSDKSPEIQDKPKNNVTNLTDVVSKFNYALFHKLILFFFQIFQKLTERHANLNTLIITNMIQFFDNLDGDTEIKDLDKNTYKVLLELSEDFFSVINMIVKFMSDKIAEAMNLKKIEELSVTQFRQFIHIFDLIKSWSSNDLVKIVTLKLEPKKPALQSLLQKYNTFSQKISILSLNNLRIEREKTFISIYSKEKTNNLKISLEDEYWLPMDIPYQYINIISYVANENELYKEYDNVENTEEILQTNKFLFGTPQKSEEAKYNEENAEENKESNGGLLGEELDSPLIPNPNSSNHEYKELKAKIGENLVKIMKNELYVDKKKFFLTSSSLLLLKMIYDYLHLVEYFPTNATEAATKLYEVIKFFNSYTCQLILGAGATHLGKIKMISARILVISALSLSLIKFLLDKINGRIEKNGNLPKEWLNSQTTTLDNDLKNHINEIFNKITSILQDRLLINCKNLEQLEWHNKNEKFLIPTLFSSQILTNTKQMYSTIQEYLQSEDIIKIFSVAINDITLSFLGFFHNLKIESKIEALRVKEELDYFYKNLLEMPFINLIEEKKNEFYTLMNKIILENCNNFIEMTSLN